MNVERGDVVLVDSPLSAGSGSKVRPAVVIQSDHNNGRLTNTIVATITSNRSRVSYERTQWLLRLDGPDAHRSGLRLDSVVTCENLATVDRRRIRKVLGSLSPATMSKIDDCLKVSLSL